MSKDIILTGLRANNDLTLGNYLGALLPIVNMQKKYAGEYQVNLFVPDLHSFTTPIDHSQLYNQIMHNLKIFIASGLELKNSETFLYRQSRIPAHSELTLILNCFTYMGELNRMTQFKDKAKNKPNVSVGLFDYPVLMAADILLYGAKYVPVGEDQTQHVELARDIAIRMNNKFGPIFEPPEEEKKQIEFANQQSRLRIRDLVNPIKKMSKSDESGKGVVFMGDDPGVAYKKVMSATTDSINHIRFHMDTQPGISNLITILSQLEDRSTESVLEEFGGNTQYGPFKIRVAETVKQFLSNFQSKLNQVSQSDIDDKLTESELAMNRVANATLLKVQKVVGLRR
jgi:tryptophanyl-tRNA synthetase